MRKIRKLLLFYLTALFKGADNSENRGVHLYVLAVLLKSEKRISYIYCLMVRIFRLMLVLL